MCLKRKIYIYIKKISIFDNKKRKNNLEYSRNLFDIENKKIMDNKIILFQKNGGKIKRIKKRNFYLK